MDIYKYLERINYHGDVGATKKVLFNLQKNHLLSVPFENLDIHYGRRIVLDTELFYTKIVENKRGGFCYELNGLFYLLLREIGFNVIMVSAKVHDGNGGFEREFDHLAIVAEIDEHRYLVDVGFGKFSLEPLEIIIGQNLKDKFGDFRFSHYNTEHLLVSLLKSEEVAPQYIFSFQKRKLSEFSEMCHFQQTSPDSHFTKNKMISLARKNGRITLTNEMLKISDGRGEIVMEFDEGEFDSKMEEYFGIVIL